MRPAAATTHQPPAAPSALVEPTSPARTPPTAPGRRASSSSLAPTAPTSPARSPLAAPGRRAASSSLALATLFTAALLACQTTANRPGGPVSPEPPAPLPDPVHAPVNRETGELLEATVPLLDGAGLPLADLRGRVVVLELTATWADRWTESYAFYNRLLQQHGPDKLAVVIVAMDNEQTTLSPEPGVRGRGFDLGWDPAGALAARLQVAALPTVVVLDRQGRISFVQGGSPAGATVAIEDGIRQALATP